MAWNLKDPKEVKEYLENLGDEYRFGCFSEKKPKVCHLLGDYLEAIKKDWDKAGRVYKVNCDDYNYGHSCFKYATYSFLGKGGLNKDVEKATQYYDKGCGFDYPEACLHAGLMRIIESEKTKKDEKKALEFFEKGCNLDQANSCFYLSGMFMSGIEGFKEKDMSKAFIYALKACELGNIHSCANVHQMYKNGEGVEKDEKKAEEFKRKAMDMQAQYTQNFNQIKFGEGG